MQKGSYQRFLKVAPSSCKTTSKLKITAVTITPTENRDKYCTMNIETCVIFHKQKLYGNSLVWNWLKQG